MPNGFTSEATAREAIKNFNAIKGVRFSYTRMYNELSAMMRIEDETERENAFTAFHISYLDEIAERALDKRALIESNPVIAEKNSTNAAKSVNIAYASTNLKSLTSVIMSIIDPEAEKKHAMTPAQLDAIKNYELGIIEKYS